MEKVMKKLARRSGGKPYECQQPWPEDCGVQCGDYGVVLSRKRGESYQTAFFEAFPNDPPTFLRGEGETVEKAEKQAFEKLKKIRACEGHDFERRGRKDGYAFCRKCPLSGSFLEPLTRCTTCNMPTSYRRDNSEDWYCPEHYYQLAPGQVECIDEESSILSYTKDDFFLDRRIYEKCSEAGIEVESKLYHRIWFAVRHAVRMRIRNKNAEDPDLVLIKALKSLASQRSA